MPFRDQAASTQHVLRPNMPELLFDDYLIDTASGLTAVDYRAQRRRAADVEQGDRDPNICHPTGRSKAIRADSSDELGTEIAEAVIGRYAGAYLALFTVVDRTHDKIVAQWATSRDGLHWNRFFRTPLFGLEAVSVTEEAAASLEYPRVVGTRILIGCTSPPAAPQQSESGEYWLRRDGWASLDAADHRGTLVTKVIGWPEADQLGEDPWLAVNVCVKDRGDLVVRILDEHGEPWPGRPRDEASDPVRGDCVGHPVTWNGHRGIRHLGLAGQKVRLRFDMLHASLFSFCLRTATVPSQ